MIFSSLIKRLGLRRWGWLALTALLASFLLGTPTLQAAQPQLNLSP